MTFVEQKIVEINAVFLNFLKTKGLRKTKERLAMLETLYTVDFQFDVEALYFQLRQNGHHISMATIYNNIKLLIDAKLIKKLSKRRGSAAFYQKRYFKC